MLERVNPILHGLYKVYIDRKNSPSRSVIEKIGWILNPS